MWQFNVSYVQPSFWLNTAKKRIKIAITRALERRDVVIYKMLFKPIATER